MWKAIADQACEKITAGIVRAELDKSRPVQAILDPYNPTGSTPHAAFNTTRTDRFETDARRCHVNRVVLDSDWEGEFCRVAEAHPRVHAYVKNHSLGFEVPYRMQGEARVLPARLHRPRRRRPRRRRPAEPRRRSQRLPRRGRQGEGRKRWTSTGCPASNRLASHGRWAFVEFTDVWAMQHDFGAKIEEAFGAMVTSATATEAADRTAKRID